MTWTYGQNPAASDVAAVRFEIQDTNVAAQLLADEEIEWAILNETTVAAGTPATITDGPLYAASARCMESLSRNFAMQADTEVGQMKATYSRMAQTYATRAQELRAKASGFHAPYAGGLSVSEKEGWRQDTDLVRPKFRRGEFDNHWGGSRGGPFAPGQD